MVVIGANPVVLQKGEEFIPVSNQSLYKSADIFIFARGFNKLIEPGVKPFFTSVENSGGQIRFPGAQTDSVHEHASKLFAERLPGG